jgi:hypothetical protein
MIRASVVLPLPGGPQKIRLNGLAALTKRLIILSSPKMWLCPTTSDKACGRIRSANGCSIYISIELERSLRLKYYISVKLRVPVVKLSWKSIETGKSRDLDGYNKKWPKVGSVLGVLLVSIIVCGLIWRNLSSPGYGQVSIVKPDTSPTTKLPEYTSLTTNFYSVNYSQRYAQKPTDIPAAGLLDQKVLSYKLGGQPGDSTIEIDIKSAPYGGITEDGTYIYYQKRPSQYKLSNKVYQGEIVDIATSLNGQPEATALWLHGSYLMLIKLTTADKDQSITSELNDLLSSLQWRQ